MLLPFTREKKDTKNIIISVLLEEWPLSAKIIYNKVRREKGITYQAIFKTLMEMVDKGIIARENKEYRINLKWVGDIKNFIKDVELRHSEKKDPLKDLIRLNYADGYFLMNKFSTVREMDEFLFKFIFKEENFYAFVKHPWFPLIHSKEMASYSCKPCSNKVVIFSNKTPLDKDCRIFFKKLGERTPVYEKFTPCYSFSIYGNYIVQGFFEKDLMENLDRIFRKTKSIRDLDLIDFNKNFFEKKTNIVFTTIYNPILAEHLKDWLIGLGKDE